MATTLPEGFRYSSDTQRTLADAARTGRPGGAGRERRGGAAHLGLDMSTIPTKQATLAIHGGTPVRQDVAAVRPPEPG